jgi:hypothetical protein
MAVSAVAILAKSKHLVYKHFEISKTKFGNGFHIGFSLFRLCVAFSGFLCQRGDSLAVDW